MCAMKSGHDHRFGHSNRQISDRGKWSQPRLKKQRDGLQQQWDSLHEKLSEFEKQLILETRVEEKLRLKNLIAETKTHFDQVNEQLAEIESQLAKIDSDVEKSADRKDDQGPPTDRPIKELCGLLDKIQESILQDEAKKLNIELRDRISPDDLKRMLAAKMLAVGLAGSALTIRNLLSRFPKESRDESVEYMIDLIGSSWVNYHSARRMWQAAIEEKKTLCVNGERFRTAKLYVIWACICDPDHAGLKSNDCWPVINYDGIEGEGTIASYKRSIEQLLCSEFGVKKKTKLRERLKYYATTFKEPVFIVMRSWVVDHHLIQELIKSFPEVTFFLLTGPEPDQTLLENTNVEFLHPPLERDIECYYCDQYETHSHELMRKMQKLKSSHE